MSELEIMRDIAAAVLKQAKAELAELANIEGHTDYMGRRMEPDSAWREMDWRREDCVSAVIDRMVKK